MFRGWFFERLCRDPPMTSPAGNLRYIRTDFTSLDLCRAAGPATPLVYAARAAGFNL